MNKVVQFSVRMEPKGWQIGNSYSVELHLFVKDENGDSEIFTKQLARKQAIWEAQAFLNNLVVGDD